MIGWSQQDSTSKKRSSEFGIYHSANFTTFNGSTSEVFNALTSEKIVVSNPRFTFDFGVFGGFELSRKVVFQVELAYSYMGAHTKRQTTLYHELRKIEGVTTESYSLRYMKLPLSLQFYMKENFFLSVGGYGSALIGASKFFPWDWDKPSEALDDVEGYDAGLIFGVGMDLTHLVKFNFRYHLGMIDVFTNDDVDFRNSVYQVSFNWKLFKD